VVLTRIDGETEPVREVGHYIVQPNDTGQNVIVVPYHLAENVAYQFASDHSSKPVESEQWEKLYLGAISSVICQASRSNRRENLAPPEIVAYLRPAAAVTTSGMIATGGCTGNKNDCMVISAQERTDERLSDQYFIRRTYPFSLLESRLAPRGIGYRFLDGKRATDRPSSQENTGLSRGSALLSDNVRTKLAETGIILERLLGTAVNVEWEQDDQGTFQVANLFPASRPPREISPEEVAAAEAKATILCQGGQTVQAGIGAGRVVHVDDETSLADFPAGAVAVARFASPNLAPILQRAAAIITEYGSTAGHLATVAREQRLPAIFSLPHARTLLPPDNEITVIAGEGKVYAGIVDILLQSGEDQTFTPFDREYRTLRRLLRFITPLNLIDPESPGFSPDGCRTFHDIIHFCHEQAVDDLAHFQERRPGLGAIRTDRMQLGVPLDIRVLDIGGAMVNEAKLPFTADKVKSMPFNAFLDGLLLPAAWEHELPSLGLRDIVSAMPKSMNMLSGQGEVMAENLAIVGHDYINISLRLGYHFSVIDAHLGNDDTRNYVYFRFVGGLANIDRRERRAFFIREVLSAMDFKVSVKGDLVIGRRKSAKPKALAAVLHVLGSLTAFSKQRDTALYSDEDVRNLYAIFESSFLVPYRKRIAEVYDASGEYDHA
jgi:pyruvate,water dikinase